ncbi:UNVERIFIED_CONTAM: hypothetical protein Sradi_5986200 [Sesamum radiatum]|uniref:Uncharacterized protein n=1 Tax=Sesamum radiatum TaxID=300843 RepID=A0AAW2KFS1_SESRA
MLHGTTSKNILAMTFRQVVMQQLWSLELALFRPGTERDMDNLENPRDVTSYLIPFPISSSKVGENQRPIMEVVLTHSQMVSLADILDMFYEDVFTLPNKRLSCNAVAKSSNLAINKFLVEDLVNCPCEWGVSVAITVLRKLYLPHLPIRKNYIRENSQIPLSDVRFAPHHSVEISELETCSLSIIRRIKDSFGWPGEIRMNSNACVWTGELPKFLREVDDSDSNMLDILSPSIPPGAINEETVALEDIASYQVVLSTDGNIIGFQPTNRIAVNNWAANPLAKELYDGKNLSPGLVEPGLKISHPSGVVALELLMSLNPRSNFALVRPVDVSG